MKLLLLTFPILVIAFNLSAQEQVKIKVSRINTSELDISKDTNMISFQTAEKIALSLDMSLLRKGGHSNTYFRNTGLFEGYYAGYFAQPVNPANESFIKLRNNTIYLKPNEQVYVYGFTSKLGEGKKAARNYSRFLMSAYRQELDSKYSQDLNNFSVLAPIEKSEYWKRNWINMGYGASYLVKDNPFAGSKSLSVATFYIIESLFYIPTFGGPFMGETTGDKIKISLTGVTCLILTKVFFGSTWGNKHIKLNKSIRQSGYKIPNNFE